MRQSPRVDEQGFLLITVVVVLGVLAVVALMLVTSTSLDNALAARHMEDAELDYIAEAGLAHAAWLLSRHGSCDNYPNKTNQPFGAGSYSTVANPGSGSPVTLTAVGKLADGTQRTFSRNDVKVIDVAVTKTKPLRPGPEGKDTYISDGENKNSNFGATAYMELNNAGAERVMLLSFDLSSIPADATIVKATLELWLEGGSNLNNGVIDAHEITQSWFEGEEDDDSPSAPGATWLDHDGTNPWASPGGDYDPTPVDSITIQTLAQGWHQWDVSALAVGGVASALATDGVVLRASGGVVDRIKFTSSDGNAAERPRLVVSYACECGESCVGGGGGADTMMVSTDSDAELGGLSFQDTDVVEYDPTSDTATLLLDSAAAGMAKKVDAVHLLGNGHIVLSTKDDTTFAGLDFKKEDLIEYDPIANTATMYLEAAVHFEVKKNIISVHVLGDGKIVLSTDGNARLGGLDFSDKDLVLYDRSTGSASIYFDGDATTLSKKITAVHIRPNGRIVLAADGNTTLGGLSFGPDQLIDYDPVADVATLFFDGESLFSETSEKIRSAHIGPGSGT